MAGSKSMIPLFYFELCGCFERKRFANEVHWKIEFLPSSCRHTSLE
jgi:hypothetical protein